MKKTEVAVKITEKNIGKVHEILKMFGEKIYKTAEHRLINKVSSSEYPYINYYNNHWEGVRSGEGKSTIKPKQLKQILAKEHLKEGDVIVCESNGSDAKYIVEFETFNSDRIFGKRFVTLYSVGGHSKTIQGGAFANFLRYATEEEKELLNHKKELEVGKWYTMAYYDNPKEVVSIHFVERIEGDKVWYSYGIDLKNNEWKNKDWYNSRHASVESTKQEVEEALIKEAKRRGLIDGVNIKSLIDGSTRKLKGGYHFSPYPNYFNLGGFHIFENGVWAEIIEVDKFAELKEAHKNGAVIQYRHKYVDWTDCEDNSPKWFYDCEYRIKPETKPKKCDVVKAWMKDPEMYVIGIYSHYREGLGHCVSGEYRYNAKVVTPEEVIELLFKK